MRSRRLSGHDDDVGRAVAQALAGFAAARSAPGQVPDRGLAEVGASPTRPTPRGTWCRYWRLLKFKLANPHIITRGMVFLGKGVEIQATPELSTMEIGRWVHIGDKNTIRCHEGSLRFGDKVVLGRDNVINTYLDIELGDSVLMADWVSRVRLRPQDGRHQRADQRSGHPQGPGADRARTPGSPPRSPSCATRRSGAAACWVRTAWSRATSLTMRSPSARRRRSSRTGKLAWETSAAERAELAAALADIERKKASRWLLPQ